MVVIARSICLVYDDVGESLAGWWELIVPPASLFLML